MSALLRDPRSPKAHTVGRLDGYLAQARQHMGVRCGLPADPTERARAVDELLTGPTPMFLKRQAI